MSGPLQEKTAGISRDTNVRLAYKPSFFNIELVDTVHKLLMKAFINVSDNLYYMEVPVLYTASANEARYSASVEPTLFSQCFCSCHTETRSQFVVISSALNVTTKVLFSKSSVGERCSDINP